MNQEIIGYLIIKYIAMDNKKIVSIAFFIINFKFVSGLVNIDHIFLFLLRVNKA